MHPFTLPHAVTFSVVCFWGSDRVLDFSSRVSGACVRPSSIVRYLSESSVTISVTIIVDTLEIQTLPSADKPSIDATNIHQHEQPVWFENTQPRSPGTRALIIGAGMAGAATARSLAERGWQVRIIDTHSKPAGEASGNPQGMLYTRLSGHSTVLSRFITQGYFYSLKLLTRLENQTSVEPMLWQKTGLIQLAFNDAEKRRQQNIIQLGECPTTLLQWMNAESLSSLAGLPLNVSGLYFPDAGWVHPPALCRLLIDHPNIHFTGNLSVTQLTHNGTQWLTNTEANSSIQSDIVVMTCGHRFSNIGQMQYLPLKSIRGQITQRPATSKSRHLQTVVCSEGYIAPAWNDIHTLGATFNFNDHSTTCQQKAVSNTTGRAPFVE